MKHLHFGWNSRRPGNQGSGRLQDVSENHRSSSGRFRNLARRLNGSSDLNGSTEFVVPKSLADRRRGIIEVRSQNRIIEFMSVNAFNCCTEIRLSFSLEMSSCFCLKIYSLVHSFYSLSDVAGFATCDGAYDRAGV